ncbi:MAG: peptidoglycan DD-metalloendopeptidase family protein [Deltaproteobacteria bacterium]|nr:peptidoglycan DD-metalloendopeptidase family protein [Deltaproteobacteria bacterium]
MSVLFSMSMSMLMSMSVSTSMVTAMAVLATSAAAQEETEGSENDQLRDMREQILEARERVGAREREERKIFDRLEEIDRKIDQLTGQVAQARGDAERARASLAETVEREAEAAVQLERTRGAMSRRVVALYKTGEVGPLRVLFASNSLPELLGRASILRKLLEHDSSLVKRFRREYRALEVARSEAKERALARDETAQRLETRSSQLVGERGTKTALLARVRSDRTMERALLVELENAARALEAKLVALGETSRRSVSGLDASHFESQKGTLLSPIQGPIHDKVASGFGRVVDAEFHTETFNKGVEFEVALGDSVRAVAFGEVRFAGWFRGYGKIVILDHGNQYFTVSGHLADLYVEVGQTVDRGDTLATAGDSGSLTGARLYFEVRRGSEPLDPVEWLQSSGR